MGKWLAARLGRALLAAWGITSVVFLLVHVLLTTPNDQAVSDSSDLSRTAPFGALASRQAAQQARRHRLELDLPVFYVTRSAGPAGQWCWHGSHNQYHQWLRRLLRGNLGYSYRDGQSVTSLLRPALAYTLPLMAAATGLATAIAIGLALALAQASATKKWPRLVRSVLTSVQAVPLFALALALLLLLANPDLLNVLPTDDMSIGYPAPGGAAWLASYVMHLVLPLFSLLLAVLPELTLPLEAGLRQELHAGYASTARAKGLTTWQIVRRHALPNALLPLLTTFTGLLPSLVAGAVVVEVLFALPGTGRLLAEAAAAHDYPVVLAGVLLTATARLLALLAADILYFWVDPRLRPTP